MKKTTLRILCLSALLLTAAMVTASCGDAATTPATTPVETQATVETETETEEPRYPAPDITGLDYGGATVTMISPQWGTLNMLYTEELDGEPVNDAAYNRIVDTENALNVDIQFVWGTDADTHLTVKKAVMAGDDAYQIIFTHCVYGLGDYLTNHLLYNLDKIPHLNFDAPWWDKNMVETYRIGGNTYYAAGDLLIQNPTVLLFNKSIAAEYDMDDHYQLVRDGKWTYDKFIENGSMVSVDLNGDGKMDENDKYGYMGDMTEALGNIPFACGERITNVTENGIELVFWSDKMVEIFNKTNSFFMNKSVSAGYFRSTQSGPDFSDGNGLYTMSNERSIQWLRDVDLEFGILPLPKWDEAQSDYYTFSWAVFTCVPTTVGNIDMVGATLEEFCYLSEPVGDAFEEILIRGKSTRDVESLEMLDIIKSSYVYDVCGNFLGFDTNGHKIFYCFYELMSAGKDNIASHYEKSEKAVKKTIDKLYDSIMAAE